MGLQKAELLNVSKGDETPIKVLFNPTEYTIERNVNYAELQIPGKQLPILQFVRGEAQTLNLELFLDRTATGATIEEDLTQLRSFVTIDAELHAPPICRFQWGTSSSSEASVTEERQRDDNTFTGVVTSFQERHLLFDEDGRVLRARVTLTLKSYRSGEAQARQTCTQSPDRTRVRVLREGETLSRLANEAYGDPRLWRLIAGENDIDRPLFIAPGTALRIPSVDAAGRT